ncbi:response regulator, partial [bacterium]|nr:response regulator [bacterium]
MKQETNILVIDDAGVMRDLLMDILTEAGHKTTVASTGREGLDRAKKNIFDLVITDLKISDIDGLQIIEAIKKNDPEIMTIIITAYASVETAQDALRKGVFDYITKPFESKELLFIVDRAIKAKKLKMANQQLMKNLIDQKVKLEEEVEDLSILYKIKQEISSTLELNAIFKIIVDRAADIVDAETCVILLINSESKELFIQWSHGLSKEKIE